MSAAARSALRNEVRTSSRFPISADAEEKHPGELPGNLLVTLGDSGKNGDGTKYRDDPK